ncbi:hypothetical protein [Aeromonas encheleia]|uniref:Lipoprotein n=1 Tax=Aeromonas encheleia TaxID=73010 RepID=A0AAE9MIH4_9GAMM|nr:hypothetical protein [Aeromonas encheleia]USV58784.1 hypothetical protein NHF51_06465 [Aeromonas encheleia]
MKTSITLLAATLLCSSCAAVQPSWHQTDGSLGQTQYYVDVNERADFRIICSNHHIKMSFTDQYGDVRLAAVIIDGQRFDDYDFFSIDFKYEEDADKFRPLWTKLRSAKRITVIADTTPQKSFELPTSTVAKVLPADFTQCDGQQT